MRRLYRSIYLAVITSLLAVVVIAGLFLRFGLSMPPMNQNLEFASEFVAAMLPGSDRPRPELVAAIRRIAERLRTDVNVFDAQGERLAASGENLAPPRANDNGGFRYDRGGPTWSLQLTDGRWVVLRAPARHGNPILALLLTLAGVAGIVALFAYPVVRGLTRRIERLQAGVETLAAGDLRTRVKVEGKDEVARLAESFNHAAARIEDLVGAHRMLLANASHELRTPLSRIKLGLELLRQSDDPKYRAAVEEDLRELEDLIESLLTTSRLDAATEITSPEPVDLLALAAEEAAHFDDVSVEGASIVIDGDAKLLRRLVRNLLENASRHGRPPIEARVSALGPLARLDVIDHGPGIPVGERERIFEPFYRARRDTPGTGLGLSLVRRIAKLHGGDARVVDAPGGATCLRAEFALPRKPA